jgi:PAS domain S-box-containing protein
MLNRPEGQRDQDDLPGDPARSEPSDLVLRGVSDVVFGRIYAKSPLGYGLVGPDLRFLDVNPALCTMLGYERTELLGRPYAEVTHPDDAGLDVDLGRRVFAGEIPSYFLAKRFVTKSGEVRSVELYASAVDDPTDDTRYGVAIINDVTQRVRAEASRRLLHDTLVVANETPSPNLALQTTTALVCDHLGWELGHAYLLSVRGELESTGVWHIDGNGFEAFRAASEELRWGPGRGIPGTVLQTRKPLWITDVRQWPKLGAQVGQRDGAPGGPRRPGAGRARGRRSPRVLRHPAPGGALRLAFDPNYAPGPAGHDLVRAGESILALRSARRRVDATIEARWGDAPALAGQALDYAVSLLKPDAIRPPAGLSRSGDR